MEEIWKDVKEFEGLYQVSNIGNVKRLISERVFAERSIGRIVDRDGYLRRTLCKNGLCKQITEHRLVATAFIENSENKATINHINGIKNDNRVENLEWNTDLENKQHAVKNGLMNFKGIKHNKCKLTELQVLEIREIGFSQTRTFLSKKYNVSRITVLRIIRRSNWNHI
jgi:hypothetical protein